MDLWFIFNTQAVVQLGHFRPQMLHLLALRYGTLFWEDFVRLKAN